MHVSVEVNFSTNVMYISYIFILSYKGFEALYSNIMPFLKNMMTQIEKSCTQDLIKYFGLPMCIELGPKLRNFQLDQYFTLSPIYLKFDFKYWLKLYNIKLFLFPFFFKHASYFRVLVF